MSSDLAKLRAAAEPYKSFPKAVAALIRAAFDRGATEVKVRFHSNDVDSKVNLWVEDNGPKLTRDERAEISDLANAAMRASSKNIGLTYVHHANILGVAAGNRQEHVQLTAGLVNVVPINIGSYSGPNQIGFLGLGTGEGVNPKQDRSAKRLVRELPRLLSPREAIHTTVIDEEGKLYELAKGLHGTTVDGLRISWPEKMVGSGREGLTLKFGAMRVSMKSFIDRRILEPAQRKQLMLLTHPWLRGTIEVEVADPQVASIPVPSEPADNFFDFFYGRGHADQLAKAILQIIPAVAIREMNKLVMGYVHDFVEDDALFLSGHTYKVVCADQAEVRHSAGRLLWEGSDSTNVETQLFLDVTHPVFRTVSTYDQEVMQIIWWQLATWIEFNDRAIIDDPALLQAAITQTYLSLRGQNPDNTLVD